MTLKPLALTLSLMVLLTRAALGDTVLHKTSKRFQIVGEDELAPAAERPGQHRPPGWQIKKVSIIRVVNKGGNNPFHPVEPINNKSGRIVRPVVPGTSTSSICGGKYARYQRNVNTGGVSLIFDPTTRTCNLISRANPNDRRGIALGIDTAARDQWAFIPAAPPSIWQFVPAVISIDFPFNTQSKTFRVRHKSTGNVYEITFKPDIVLGGGVRLVRIVKL